MNFRTLLASLALVAVALGAAIPESGKGKLERCEHA